MEGAIKNSIILFVFGLIGILFLAKKISLEDSFVILLPFKGINFDVGLMLYAYQVILIFLLIKMFFFRFRSIVVPKFLFFYLIFISITTVVVSVLFVNFVKVENGNFFREEGRFMTQLIVLWLFQYSVVFYVVSSEWNTDRIKKAIKYFLLSATFLGVLGIIQLLAFLIFKIDILPIQIKEDGYVRTGLLQTAAGDMFIRICSLGGEPKGFAITEVVAFSMIYILRKFKIFLFSKKVTRLMMRLFIVVILLSFSTSAWVMLLAFPFLVFILDVVSLQVKLSVRRVASLALSITILAAFSFYFWDYIYYFINARILERNIVGEDFDAVIQSFLVDKPIWAVFGSGLGNIHNMANGYVPSELSFFMGNTIIVAKSGYLKIISEQGVVGFLIFFMMIGYYLYLGHKFSPKERIVKALIYLFLVLLVFFLMRTYAMMEFLFVLGLFLATIRSFVRKGSYFL